jgi:large subunit ribosomal protein L30
MMPASLRVTLRKSPISYTAAAHGALRALGLHRIGQSRVLPDDPVVRGQVRAVRFLLDVEELPATTEPGTRSAPEEEAKP